MFLILVQSHVLELPCREGWNSIAAGIRFSELRLSGCQDVLWRVSLHCITSYAAVEVVGRIPRESLKHWAGAWMMGWAGGGKRVKSI